ncbi:LLM class flavin-dependent oxidoreductase [Robertmurraya korlensis]|uniref:LLM class flavin-dependent oxidoreductase n=1 Tax=Robertmurraya korlensis TaxID=519977 RepID=UPI000824614E|nr:LLM class flavin-dependent oxidoreductase [Robertmurraya korlensis]
MKLSILDQSPLISGKSPQQALQASMQLARWGEELGYTRYWIAEHHDFPGLTCPAPEVMLPYIGANTSTIRIGAGAILLPYYKPYKVAESFNLLATLFPGRIDLGIGRAPGGSAEVTEALSGQFLQQVWRMPESFEELLHFLHHDFPQEHLYSGVTASPRPIVPPQTWLLGTSGKSAKLAAEMGTSYAFGHFMSEKPGPDIMKSYLESFVPVKQPTSETIVAVSVICADTTEMAEDLALSGYLWRIKHLKGEGKEGVPSLEEAKSYRYTEEEMLMIDDMKKKIILGNPVKVSEELQKLQALYHADEIMIVTITPSYEDREQSYKLIAKECITKN